MRRTTAALVTVPLLLAACTTGASADRSTEGDRPTVGPSVSAPGPRTVTAESADGTDTGTSDGADTDHSARPGEAGTSNPAAGSRRCRPDLVPGPPTAAERDATTAEPGGAGAPTDADSPITVRVWHTIGNDLESVLEAMFRRFDQLHDGISVESTRFETYDAALRAFASADPDDAPDLLLGQADGTGALAASERFVPPFECADGERPEALRDLLPVIERTFAIDGRYVAVPFLISTPVLVYDRTRWAAAGLDPDRPPTSAEALESAARALVTSGVAPGGLVLYDRSASWFLEQWAAREGRLLVTPDNGHDPSVDPADRRAAFETPEAAAALDWLKRVHDDGLIRWIGLNPMGIDDLFQLVDPNDPAGMTLHTSAATGDLTRLLSAPDTPFPDAELGIGPLPGPGRGSLVGGNAWWLTDTGDPARIGAAWTVAEWFVRPDQMATLTNTSGYVPLSERAAEHPSVVSWWRQEPNFAVGFEQLVASGSSPAAAGMRLGPRVELQRVLELAAVDVVADHLPVADVLADANERADALLALYAESESFDDPD